MKISQVAIHCAMLVGVACGIGLRSGNTPSTQVLIPVESELVVTGGDIQLSTTPVVTPSVDSCLRVTRYPRVTKSGSTCGGPYQSSCYRRKPATYEKKAEKNDWTCPTGSFLDLVGDGCYTCPPHARRTAHHIASEKACVEIIHGRATLVTKMGCGNWPGSFFDPINQGTCWQCPDGYPVRTWAPVTAGDACVAGGWFSPAAHATQKGSNVWACPSGSFFDPNGGCYSCPVGYSRSVFSVESDKACYYEKLTQATKVKNLQCDQGTFYDPIDGGTCWRCPLGYERTWSPVKNEDACLLTTIDWFTERESTGFFNIPGVENIVQALQHDQTFLNSLLTASDTSFKKLFSVQGTIQELILELEQDPRSSILLKNAVMYRIINHILNPDKDIRAPENCAANWLAGYIRETRIWVATESKKMLDAYKRGQETRKTLFGTFFGPEGRNPPFEDIVRSATNEAAAKTIGVSMALATGIPATILAGQAFKAIQPFAVRLGTQALVTSLKGALGALAGPGAIVLAGVMIAIERLEILLFNAESQLKIENAVIHANLPYGSSELAADVGKDASEFISAFLLASNGGGGPYDAATTNAINAIISELKKSNA